MFGLKSFKLSFHQKTSNTTEDLCFNSRDFPEAKVGDILEIFHPGEESCHLLLQVKSLKDSVDCQLKDKDVISVSNVVGKKFELRPPKEVAVCIVDPQEVAIDLVELVFKDQYFSRSDMWRMRLNFVKTCLYHGQKVEFAEMRATVEEIWSKGLRVMCGIVTDETRVSFRSSTAQVNIFIQMSSEMWEFDNYGDLYFEKVVDGYLIDLFNLWKEKGCNHDVTITLFSRTFYEANSVNDFPEGMRECICVDYAGRFYEDFYRVVVQNERYDEWAKPIRSLKQIFNEYDDYVLHFHEQCELEVKNDRNDEDSYPRRWNPLAAKGMLPPATSKFSSGNGQRIPRGWNSMSSEGNFLEVLNMALNVFEKYYLDRCFDRTGKLSIVITPGVGIFDVDRELMNVTKQRTIDCGSSVDLVCMGEQPLYAVPLFKFHSRNCRTWSDVGDDYNIPHWINQSFYLSRNQLEVYDQEKVALNVKIVDSVHRAVEGSGVACNASAFGDFSEFPWESSLSSEVPFVDYDEYDAQIFRPFSNSTNDKRSKTTEKNAFDVKQCRVLRTPFTLNTKGLFSSDCQEPAAAAVKGSKIKKYMPHSFAGIQRYRNEQLCLRMVGSMMIPFGHHLKNSSRKYRHKALVNPLAPSRLDFKVTSNQRRWSHVHPSVRKSCPVPQSVSVSSIGPEPSFHISSPSRETVMHMLMASDHRRQRRPQHSSECSESSEKVPSLAGSCVNTNSADSLREAEAAIDGATRGGYQDSMYGTLRHVGSLTSMANAYESSYSSSLGRIRTTSLRLNRPSSTSKEAVRPVQLSTQEPRGRWSANDDQDLTSKNRAAMDWKGMAIPASLPLTTDYFPGQHSLETAYLVADYSLVDEMARSSEAELIQVGRKPLTIRQVFNQMVYQRLAQGFQIVITPKNSIMPRAFRKGPAQFNEQVMLSIGRIFHKVTLYDTRVVVMRFWPRHPASLKTYHYKYRFQVPDSNTYDVSWTDFYTEKLELFNWNYVDHYLITRGEEHYKLQTSHKYWRARFFLLPLCSAAMKLIVEGATDVCNIYQERSVEKQLQLVEGFLRFLEVANKLKRLNAPRTGKPRDEFGRRGSIDYGSLTAGLSEMSKLAKDCNSSTDPFVMHSVPATQLGFECKKALQGLTASVELSSQTSPSGHAAMSQKTQDSPYSKCVSTVTVESSNAEILQAMTEGLTFFKSQQDLPMLPSLCFVAADAVFWSRKVVAGVTSVAIGVSLMERLVREKLICHASGDTSRGFIFGFYLYFIVSDDSRLDVGIEYYERFEHEWCESATVINFSQERCALVAMFADTLLPKDAYAALSGEVMDAGKERLDQYKIVHVDVDSMNRSDREEWGWARYHRLYNPDSAFELTVEWLVATGCILGDLVLGWTRKAKDFGFHFLPVPCDPFALPFNPNSDPLRGPVFVPLNVGCLTEDGSELFGEFSLESRAWRLVLFQHEIVKLFGFMWDSCPVSDNFSSPSLEKQALQYVHCTGSMFVMILSGNTFNLDLGSAKAKSLQQQYKEYIACQCNRKNPSSSFDKATTHCVGFLWAWNFMLSKRWRSVNTGDEVFQDRILSDFRKFCSNADGRLKSFWVKLKELHNLQMKTEMEFNNENLSFTL